MEWPLRRRWGRWRWRRRVSSSKGGKMGETQFKQKSITVNDERHDHGSFSECHDPSSTALTSYACPDLSGRFPQKQSKTVHKPLPTGGGQVCCCILSSLRRENGPVDAWHEDRFCHRYQAPNQERPTHRVMNHLFLCGRKCFGGGLLTSVLSRCTLYASRR